MDDMNPSLKHSKTKFKWLYVGPLLWWLLNNTNFMQLYTMSYIYIGGIHLWRSVGSFSNCMNVLYHILVVGRRLNVMHSIDTIVSWLIHNYPYYNGWLGSKLPNKLFILSVMFNSKNNKITFWHYIK